MPPVSHTILNMLCWFSMIVTCFFWWLNFLFLYSDHVSNGCAIMTVELSTIVDLFLMSFPIMQTIIPIRSYPRESWRRSKPVLYNLCFQLQHSETLGPYFETRSLYSKNGIPVRMEACSVLLLTYHFLCFYWKKSSILLPDVKQLF